MNDDGAIFSGETPSNANQSSIDHLLPKFKVYNRKVSRSTLMCVIVETGVRNESALMLIERKKTVVKKPSARAIMPKSKEVEMASIPPKARIGDTTKPQQELSSACKPKAASTKHSNLVSSAPSLPKAVSIQSSTSASATPAVRAAARTTISDQELTVDPGTQSVKAAASIPVVESKSSIGDTASAAHSGASPACTKMLTMHFRTLDGVVSKSQNYVDFLLVRLTISVTQTHIVKTPEDATFGFIKHKFLAKLVNYHAIQIRIIFCGTIVENDATPRDMNCMDVRASPTLVYLDLALVHTIQASFALLHAGIVFTCHQSGGL